MPRTLAWIMQVYFPLTQVLCKSSINEWMHYFTNGNNQGHINVISLDKLLCNWVLPVISKSAEHFILGDKKWLIYSANKIPQFQQQQIKIPSIDLNHTSWSPVKPLEFSSSCFVPSYFSEEYEMYTGGTKTENKQILIIKSQLSIWLNWVITKMLEKDT